jgi:succinate dehydrogenase/fumarate reductase flavoprotein subunit
LPTQTLSETLRRYNEMVDGGEDGEFGRFRGGRVAKPFTEYLSLDHSPPAAGRHSIPRRISTPPFYAIQYFPISRKSMGGVLVDRSCRALDKDDQPIPGLYAIGELTGQGGLNGRWSLEGTFLGSCVLMGRVAGRAIHAESGGMPGPVAATEEPRQPRPRPAAPTSSQICNSCHNIEAAVARPRAGYTHFENAHRRVLERRWECSTCHAEMEAFNPEHPAEHRRDPFSQMATCVACHVAQE